MGCKCNSVALALFLISLHITIYSQVQSLSIGNILNSDPLHKESCFRPPESVLINCQVHNTDSWECIESNVISIPFNKNYNDRILINCTAPFPIDVKVFGFQLQDTYKTSFVRNAENVFNEATFVYSIGFAVDNLSSPRRVSVMKYNDPTNLMSFFLFRPGDEIFSSDIQSWTNSIRIPIEKKSGKMIIPCISRDPYQIPKLYLWNLEGSGSSLLNNYTGVTYGITEGFILDTSILTNPEGIYYCSEKNSSLINSGFKGLSFEILPRKAQDFMVEPMIQDLILFEKEELKLGCRYNRKIQLVGKFRGENIKSKTTVDDNFISKFSYKRLNVGDEGKIDCIDEESRTILYSWTIKTLDIYNNSQLQLKKLDRNEVACISSEEGVRLETLFCQGVSNCDLNLGCFGKGSKCSKIRTGNPCNLPGGISASCLNFTQEDGYFSQGMIRCSVKNYSYITKYFRGFDGILYLDWEKAPLDALIDVRIPQNVTMYPHNSYPFGCRASRFISDGKLQWVIRGNDGSEVLLHKKRMVEINSTYNLDQNLYTVRESRIRLIFPNHYDMMCMVPIWNATRYLRNHKRISVAERKAPVKEILIGAGILITLLIIPLVYVIWRLREARDAVRNLNDQEVEEFVKGNPVALQHASKDKNAHEVVDAIPYNRDFEIPRGKLLIDTENVLGEGAFGTVLKGKLEGMSEVVAVKTVKPRCEVVQFKGFLSELKIMMYIGKHSNVVGLIGAHTDKIREKVIYIVVEYCAHGSLENMLRDMKHFFINQIEENQIHPNKTDPSHYQNLSNSTAEPQPKMIRKYMNNTKAAENLYQNLSKSTSVPETETVKEDMNNIKTVDLLRWSYEIANGMNYLASKKVVHADLAARNVLIHENGTAKITDFGLSRQLFNYTQYVKKQQEPLPWRWMAIESLKNLSFSTQSDVWSYGVTLWELFSLGDIPYPGLVWTITFVEQLTNGLRLVKPPFATTGIYDIMVSCWLENPTARPNFQLLSECFHNLLESLNVEIKKPLVLSLSKIEDNISIRTESIVVANIYQNESK